MQNSLLSATAALIDVLAVRVITDGVDWDAVGESAAFNLRYIAGVLDCADKIKSALLRDDNEQS